MFWYHCKHEELGKKYQYSFGSIWAVLFKVMFVFKKRYRCTWLHSAIIYSQNWRLTPASPLLVWNCPIPVQHIHSVLVFCYILSSFILITVGSMTAVLVVMPGQKKALAIKSCISHATHRSGGCAESWTWDVSGAVSVEKSTALIQMDIWG